MALRTFILLHYIRNTDRGSDTAVARPATDMLHRTALGTHRPPHVDGPSPSRIVGGAADCHPTNADDFEFSLLEDPHFVGLLKSLQNHFVQGGPPYRRRYTRELTQAFPFTLETEGVPRPCLPDLGETGRAFRCLLTVSFMGFRIVTLLSLRKHMCDVFRT